MLTEQQLQSLRDNFFNDDHLMSILCSKLELESVNNFNGLINYISNCKRLQEEYKTLKEELLHKSKKLKDIKLSQYHIKNRLKYMKIIRI